MFYGNEMRFKKQERHLMLSIYRYKYIYSRVVLSNRRNMCAINMIPMCNFKFLVPHFKNKDLIPAHHCFQSTNERPGILFRVFFYLTRVLIFSFCTCKQTHTYILVLNFTFLSVFSLNPLPIASVINYYLSIY